MWTETGNRGHAVSGDMTDEYPDVASDALAAGPWELTGRSEDRVFRTPMATVTGHTLVYEDTALRDALTAAGAGAAVDATDDGGDRLVSLDRSEGPGVRRFFFATGLSFSPPLAPGIGPASMQPTVVTEARRSFADDLRARGFEDVDTGRSQRFRTDAGDRGRLSKVTGTVPLSGGQRVDVEGWLGVWNRGGTFRIAGGAYPVSGLDALLDSLPADERPDTAPGGYREDLLELIRAVE